MPLPNNALLAMAQQPQQQNWLQRLVRGTPTGQIAGGQDAYMAHVIEAQSNGQQPLTRQQFMQQQAMR
jgi:hypothetical protein